LIGPDRSTSVKTGATKMPGLFINVEVSDEVAGDAEIAKKLEESCSVDIFKATPKGVQVVEENLDECVLCDLCIAAAPEGSVRVVKLYDPA
jgi:NAD-dependent dihydropyrimidine dehydrogenase PreA subunit